MSQIPQSTDVLVIGGGTAGFGAAIAAARQGLNVTLLESSSKIGGVMAFCPGMPWGAAYPLDHIIGGLIAELAQRLMLMNPPAAEKRPCTLENFGPEIVYDHDIATLTLFEMLEEAGVDLRLHATAVTPVLLRSSEDKVWVNQQRYIDLVQCYDRNGAFNIKPKIVIDCSGDGDISAKAGVPFTIGDGEGNMMGVTISFHMLRVNWDEAFSESDPYFEKYAQWGITQKLIHPDLAKLYLMKGFYPDSVFCNSVHIRGVDGTDPKTVTSATQEGRRRCYQLAKFLRAHVPGFANAHMSLLSPTAGVRETRKLEGMYRLTGRDLALGTKFADGIVCCDNPIDDVMRTDASMTHEAIVDKGSYYTIPFRSLIPTNVSNLLFAGRILCADPVAFASVRGMPQCMAMGQATGTAAALAIKNNQPVQDINTDELVQMLIKQGVNGLGNTSLV